MSVASTFMVSSFSPSLSAAITFKAQREELLNHCCWRQGLSWQFYLIFSFLPWELAAKSLSTKQLLKMFVNWNTQHFSRKITSFSLCQSEIKAVEQIISSLGFYSFHSCWRACMDTQIHTNREQFLTIKLTINTFIHTLSINLEFFSRHTSTITQRLLNVF